VIAPDAERFDRLAPTYDQAVPFFAETGRSLVEWVGIAPGLRVLDLGSGRGAVGIALAEAVGMDVEIVAGDVSEQMLSRLHALRLPRVDVKYIDATAIDEPDGSFDLVFCAFFASLPGRERTGAGGGGTRATSKWSLGNVGPRAWHAGRVVGAVQLDRRRVSL
jgi:SAM-dependent methyltransferase